MKKNLLFIAFIAIGLLFSNEITAQKFAGLDKSPMDGASYPADYKESNKMVKIIMVDLN